MSKLAFFLFLAGCVVAVQLAPQASFPEDEDFSYVEEDPLDEEPEDISAALYGVDEEGVFLPYAEDEDFSEEFFDSDVDTTERVHIPWQKGWGFPKPIINEAGKATGKGIIKGWGFPKPIINEAGKATGKRIIKGWGFPKPIINEAGKATGKRIIKGWGFPKPIINEAGKATGKGIIKDISGGGKRYPLDHDQDFDDEIRVHIPWKQGWEKVKPIVKEAGIAAGKEIIKGITGGKRYPLDVVYEVDPRVKIPWKQGWVIAKPILKEVGKVAGKEIIKGVVGGKRSDPRVLIPWKKGLQITKPIFKEIGEIIAKEIAKGGKNLPVYQISAGNRRVKIPWKQGWEIAKPILKEVGKVAGKEIIKGVVGGKRYPLDEEPEDISAALYGVDEEGVFLPYAEDEDFSEEFFDSDVDERVHIPWKKGWDFAKPIIKKAGKAAGKEIIKGITGEKRYSLDEDLDVEERIQLPWQNIPRPKGWIIVGKWPGQKQIHEAGKGGKRYPLDEDFDVEGRVHIPWQKGWEKAKPIIKEAGKAAGKEIIKGIVGGKRNN